MPEGNNKKTLIVIIAIFVAIGIAAYFYASRDQSGDELLLGLPAEFEVSPVDGDLLSALRELKKLKLDDSIFRNPVWLSLTDFGQDLAPQASGRSNPFAPLSSSDPAATSTSR
jgi:hypothetical protein